MISNWRFHFQKSLARVIQFDCGRDFYLIFNIRQWSKVQSKFVGYKVGWKVRVIVSFDLI